MEHVGQTARGSVEERIQSDDISGRTPGTYKSFSLSGTSHQTTSAKKQVRQVITVRIKGDI